MDMDAVLFDISAGSPDHFRSAVGVDAVVEFGDGTVEGDVIAVSNDESDSASSHLIVTWGMSSPSDPAEAGESATSSLGLPLAITKEVPHGEVIRLGCPVKYVKVLNTGTNSVNITISILNGAKRDT